MDEQHEKELNDAMNTLNQHAAEVVMRELAPVGVTIFVVVTAFFTGLYLLS